MSSCVSQRRRFGGLFASALVVVMVWALPVGTASADPATPYLDDIARVLNQRSPGTQGKVWWLSKGNVIPAPSAPSPGWLLQTVDCWGKPACGSQPPPGGKAFLKKMEEMIATA